MVQSILQKKAAFFAIFMYIIGQSTGVVTYYIYSFKLHSEGAKYARGREYFPQAIVVLDHYHYQKKMKELERGKSGEI